MIAGSVARESDFAFRDVRTRVGGDLAVNEGSATYMSTNAQGQRVRTVGDFVPVLARQPDGTWKIQTLIVGNFKQSPAQ